MVTIQVRLDGPTSEDVRRAAGEMGVQVNRVVNREDCVQLYGSKVVEDKQDLETRRWLTPREV